MATDTGRDAVPASHEERYPPIADYALIGDCASAALVSRAGSVDWCCMPRLDRGACFGRLLDWDSGGCFALAPVETDVLASRRYLDGTLVLETTYSHGGGEATVIDCHDDQHRGREPAVSPAPARRGRRARTCRHQRADPATLRLRRSAALAPVPRPGRLHLHRRRRRPRPVRRRRARGGRPARPRGHDLGPAGR